MFNGKVYHGERGYMEMMADTMAKGAKMTDRTGVGTLSLFDAKVIFDENNPPFSTVRNAPMKMAFDEFWFFLSGDNQTKHLEEKGIDFWKGNTSREFLDSRGLFNEPEGSLGIAYSKTLREFNGTIARDKKDVVDQVKETYETLKNDKYSRRVYTTLWNPSGSKYMALTPCWHSHQFVIMPNENGEDTLHLKLLNRSLDQLFGFWAAVFQYYVYQKAMAKLLGVRCGSLSADLTHHHIYLDQLDYVTEVLTRNYGKAGELTIEKELHTLDDLLSLTWDDIKITGHEINKAPIKTPRPKMAI